MNLAHGIKPPSHKCEAILALADGSLFPGYALGQIGQTLGECVFNTSMTGYQEILSDPSYTGQIINFTYPHIGNVGTNKSDFESTDAGPCGIILREAPTVASHYMAQHSLEEYLFQRNIIGIHGVDTRQLTRHLRSHGAQNACIMSGQIDAEQAIALARNHPPLQGQDLTGQVTTKEAYEWHEKTNITPGIKTQKTIVVYDLGAKLQILRLLKDRFTKVIVVPACTSYTEAMTWQPDAVCFSNGPGDPAASADIIAITQQWLANKVPLLGICLGCQILGLALGCQTEKMALGHHGANHPVQDLATGRVVISSQNHGFCLSDHNLPEHLQVTHRSLFDNTIQGISHSQLPVVGYQGHPEACPGPQDWQYILDQFTHTVNLQTQEISN